MTKQEAQAANVVVRWAFSRRPYGEVDELQRALELLAEGAHRSLGKGVSRRSVREWAKP